ncbi:MAG: tRNA-binding protein [Candidatus Zixiibacteriota bacterium]
MTASGGFFDGSLEHDKTGTLMEALITYDDFRKVDIRVGEIIEVLDFERARNPSYKVRINFGAEIGEKWSSVQAKLAYTKEELLDRQILAVVNFPPKNIAGFQSEALILGVEKEDGSLSLLEPSRKPAVLGFRVY